MNKQQVKQEKKIFGKIKTFQDTMKKEAFERGFIKAAIEAGIEPFIALSMCKQAGFGQGATKA